MFDFDLEVDELEKEVFSIPARMEITFNYIDLSFYLPRSSCDETFKLIARHLSDLNFNYSEKIIDIFRFCIRRDAFLSKYLDKTTDGIDESQSNLMEIAQTSSNTDIAPQPSLMEMDTQSKLDPLVSKNFQYPCLKKLCTGLEGTAKIYW